MRKPETTEAPWPVAQMEEDCWLLLRAAVLLGANPAYHTRSPYGQQLRWARTRLIELSDRLETVIRMAKLFAESAAASTATEGEDKDGN